MVNRDWQIHPEWLLAHNLYLDPECPKIILEIPFHVGPNACIGGLGFGYYPSEKGWVKVKSHTYGVIVKGGASLHANVTIDRGSWRDTIIGNNARINSNVFIGHNVQIGRGVLLNEGVSISSSTEIGDYVEIWKAACIDDKCKIGNRAVIGAHSHLRTGSEVGENEVWFNDPEKGYASFQRMRRKNE